MNIEMHALPRSSIEAFAEKHNLTMEVRERSENPGPNRFYAHFKDAETKMDGGFLRGDFGDGHTPDEAIKEYGQHISGKTLVFGANRPKRLEINVPIIT